MKRRILSIIMAMAMTLSLMAVPAFAAGEDETGGSAAQTAASLPEAQNGVITLTKNVTLESGWTPDTSVTLDLNGKELTLPRMDVSNGIIITITDNSGGDTGKITATGTTGAIVWGGGTLILEKGTITSTEENLESGDNTAVFNMGTFTINDGNIQGGTKGGTGIYNTARNGSTVIETPVVCNINGGEIEASFGICAFGLGVSNGDLSTVENDRVMINIKNGTIRTNGQGIATNASSGRYAGFTVNMRGGAIVDMDGASTGMYLPAIGVTNITDGTITAAQGIRIGAGELNISGGTIACTAVANGNDLRPGGSGGTTGAIVVGKASGGYVGDIEVNVSDRAVIENTATKSEDPNAVYPTIVVSDKNMADSTDQPFKDPVTGEDIHATFDYSETSTSVTVDAQVRGDIVKTSTLPKEAASENDGGNTKLEISGGTVTGNVINQTRSSDLNITGGTVTGNVTNESEGSVGINGASVTGDVTNAAKGEVLIENNSTITGTVKNEGTGGEKGSVAILDSTVGTVTDNQGIVLVNTTVGSSEPTTNTGDNEAMIGATAYESLGEAIENAQPGNTIKLLKDITVEKGTTADYNGVYQLPAGVTLDVTATS